MVEDGSNIKTSTTPIVEELMKKFEKLNTELKKLKTKNKKGKKYSSASEDDDSSYEEEVSNKGKREKKRRDKSSYNAMSFNYNSMPSSTTYTSYPLARLHILMGQTIINESIA
jgi:hypothetical protein